MKTKKKTPIPSTVLINDSLNLLPLGPKNKSSKDMSEPLLSAYTTELLVIVLNAWRIKTKTVDPISKEPKEELAKEDVKRICRHLESIYDSFTRLGIQIIDRTGESFDYGLPEKVVAAKPQDGISKELVLETLRPTVKWNNKIFPGEVEIATPKTIAHKGE